MGHITPAESALGTPAEILQLIQALLSSNNDSRERAEVAYQSARESAPTTLILGLLRFLTSASAEEVLRLQCAVLLRQLVAQGPDESFCFGRLSPDQRDVIATELLGIFCSEPSRRLRRAIGAAVAKLAESASDSGDRRGWLSDACGWPALLPRIFCLADASTNADIGLCESSIQLLKDLVAAEGSAPTMRQSIVSSEGCLGAVLRSTLSHDDGKIKCAAILLVCKIVGTAGKAALGPFLALAPILHSSMQQLAGSGTEEFQECLQALVEVASVAPEFFKPQLASDLEPARFLSDIARARGGVYDCGLRILALEWLVTFTETKPKWLAKSSLNLPGLAVECCMEMMLEIDDSDACLKDWVDREGDDSNGDTDSDELFRAGQHGIDRVVRAVGMQSVSSVLFALVGRFALQSVWQAKHAALAAIKQTVEYLEETEHVNEMAKLLLAYLGDVHPRVRCMALHAIGMLARDQAPQFQDAWHHVVMPALLRQMDDPIPCIAVMAMVAFEVFAESLDTALMLGYAHEFVRSLAGRLVSTGSRGVRKECVTSIAVIAGSIGEDFSLYYDQVMPSLRHIIINTTSREEGELRGKVFECMSLLGMAVGKEKYLPDAHGLVAEMITHSQHADHVQREYTGQALRRTCKCLQADFLPFLPSVLPGIFAALRLDGVCVSYKPQTGGKDSEINMTAFAGLLGNTSHNRASTCDLLKRGVVANTSHANTTLGVINPRVQKLAKVRSDGFEHALQSVHSLHTFCSEMDGAFFDYVAQTAEALLPLLTRADEADVLCDEVRSAAFQVWASLIHCAREGAAERNIQSDLPQKLFRVFLQRICASMEQDTDPESLRDAADGLAECLRNVGDGILRGDELLQLAHKVFLLMDMSFQRSDQANKALATTLASATPALQQDEDDEGAQDDEDICRRGYEEVLGAAMKAAPPSDFLPCLPECGRRMSEWLASRQNKILALWLACDLLEHLGDGSQSLWPVFMPEVFHALSTKEDPGLCSSAASAISLAAPLDGFNELAPEAFRALAGTVAGQAPKQRESKEQLAMDAAVAAFVTLAYARPDLCPPEVHAWHLIVGKLPLLVDEADAQMVHGVLADLTLEQDERVLGGAGQLGRVLAVLAEVYQQEGLCGASTDTKISRIFTGLPRESLAQLAGSFSEKQRKKIELMLIRAVKNH